MNLLKSAFVLLISAALLSSCGEIREEIVFNENGAGTYDISADMIPMFRGMMTSMASLTIDGADEMDSLQIAEEVEKLIWEEFPDKIDSTFAIPQKDIDRFKGNKSKKKLLDQATMYMKGGKVDGAMYTGMLFNFKSLEEFITFNDMLDESNKNNKKMKMFSNSKTTLKVTPNSFYRYSKNSKKSKEEIEEKESDLMAMDFLKDMSITTYIEFPKKIKSIKVDGATIAERTDNSVTITYNLMGYADSESTLIDIQLE
ncbi:MAG: hypothetical protein HKO56_03195 [Bacteroidia bacterium]|nr:hypothetical protein [Bacteroidia bacterium]NNC86304.1 hypothetical protein [Bacteroidia bacterium]NNM15641.1 hypothetical protein [Bacteroidia bacterium]